MYNHLRLTALIVAQFASYNVISTHELASLITAVAKTLTGLDQGPQPSDPSATRTRPTPAQIRKSVTYDAIISFENGKAYRSLTRHLNLLGLTPGAYRRKWGLPDDYPMVAPGHHERRSMNAKAQGLGRRRPAGVDSADQS